MRAQAARRRHIPLPAALAACTAFLLVTIILGVAVGSVPLSPAAVLGVIGDHLAGHPRYSVTDAIVWEIRLPRVLLAALVGAALPRRTREGEGHRLSDVEREQALARLKVWMAEGSLPGAAARLPESLK